MQKREKIDVDLINHLVWHLLETEAEGGILIFVPGLEHITKIMRAIQGTMREKEISEDKLW
jgi:hypothetical protein